MTNNRASKNVAINVGDSVVVQVTDGETGATAQVTMTADWVLAPDQPEPPDPGPDPEPPVDGAARWLAPLEATATMDETGPIVALMAWGGQGFGYSYRYALNAAPQGVTIDADTGMLEIGTALLMRDWNFGVIVTDRTDPTLLAMFDFTLHVVAGNHKTYRPEDFGGNLTNMQNRILSDQAADEELRVTIQFAKGKTYNYDDNHWLTGIRYYRCEATGSGAAPILNCTHTGSSVYDNGPLNIGANANCFTQRPNGVDKNRMALIADADVGEDMVTLKSAGDGGRLKPGEWHAVFSYCQQLGGYPPNVRWIDFVKVTAVDGTQVMLDRPLNHAHVADSWEDSGDPLSIGKARIGPWTLIDGKTHVTERGILSGLNFAGTGITYVEGHILLVFDGCSMPDTQISMCKHVEMRNTTLRVGASMAGEPDKLSEAMCMTGCDIQKYIGGATGFAYLLMRDTKTWPTQLSPRQLRDIGGTWESHGDQRYYVPWGTGYNGPCLEYEFDGTHFIASTAAQPTWCYSSQPQSNLGLSASSWDGNRLIIPRSFAGFQDWLVWLYEGAMVFTGASVDQPGNYGRVDHLHAPADGSALWAEVSWIKGTKPTSGSLKLPAKGLRKLTWLPGTAITEGRWQDPSFIAMTGTPADRAFPDGIS